MTTPVSESKAIVQRSRRWSTVWLVPIVAVLLGLWLVWRHYQDQGPMAYVRFETADSIAAGKTEVRCRSVLVGYVEMVSLAADLRSVVVGVRMNPESSHLLRENSRFWVVRARASASEISGLDTIFRGSYIELDPGDGRQDVHHFDGLESPPATSSSVPGLRITLMAEQAGSLAQGSPVYYKGFEVGRVEKREFDMQKRQTRFDVFIEEQFTSLVHEGTCFWNTSGLDISAGAEGFRFRTPSLQAMISGGVSFAVPPGGVVGKEAINGTEFRLFPDEGSTRDATFTPDRRCLLFFDQSVRGLNKGAPVEFRGIPLGRVVDISFKYNPQSDPNNDPRVPVLIELDASILRTSENDAPDVDTIFANAVKYGLRARLSTASLLTGALFVEMDFFPEAEPAELAKLGDYDVVPTHSSGLVQLEAKINAILAKVEALPLEETLTKFGKSADEITATVSEARGALAAAEKLLAREETQNLTAEMSETIKQLRTSINSLGPQGNVQGDLHRTLDELRAALRAFKTLSDGIADKPNSLIFGRESSGDPVPRAKRR